MYKVKINDLIISDLELNGNNFILKETVDKDLEGYYEGIEIIDKEGNTEIRKHVKIKLTQVLDKQAFIIVEVDKQELENEKLKQLIADLTETMLLGGM